MKPHASRLAPQAYTLPWPPGVNKYWRHDRGRTHISTQGKAYRSDVLAAVWSLPRLPILTAPIAVTIELFQRRQGGKCDLDNFNKGLLDALVKAGVFANDNQIDDLHILRGERCDEPRAEVRIDRLD